ncbi:MAG: hypothetical protein C5B47_00075 [Verrucomicrobia bacterium]|nr:MAG: hypothetical protein C5B47_00075 [Verrucomicrobiota bacterium]
MDPVVGRSPSRSINKFFQKVKNHFVGGVLNGGIARIMRNVGRPRELTHEEVIWRLNHGRGLSGYTIKDFPFGIVTSIEKRRQTPGDNTRLCLDHTELINCSLADLQWDNGTLKGARVTNLDLNGSRLGNFYQCDGWDMRGLSGTVLLKGADPSDWRLSKGSRSISFSEVKKASDNFKGENENESVDVDPLLDAALYIYALTDVRYPSDNAKAKVKLAHHIVNQITSECSECDIEEPLQRGAWLFFKDKIKNLKNKPKDLQPMTEEMERDGIFALYEHAKKDPKSVLYSPSQEWQMYDDGYQEEGHSSEGDWRKHRPAQQEIKKFVYEKVCREFLKKDPDLSYFRKMIEEIKKMGCPNELSNVAECFYQHYKGQPLNQEQQEFLQELSRLCLKYIGDEDISRKPFQNIYSLYNMIYKTLARVASLEFPNRAATQ